MRSLIIKRLALLPLLLLVLLPSKNAEASHLMGVDLTYECINNCTIRVHLRAYRDCTGSTVIGNNVTFTATNGCPSTPLAIGGWSPQQTTEVTPVCPSITTKCSNAAASINGVEEFYWWRDYDICSVPGCTYTMSWSECCRNPAITSLSGASGQSMYIGSTTLNTGITPCNSTPQFANPPVPYICQNTPFTFNQGAIDPDGDSLSYTIGPCYQGAPATQVTYNAGFGPLTPLGPDWLVSMNPVTGDITFTPNPASATPGSIQVGVLCVYVQEWRNGVMIGEISRDIQITVINCGANAPPTSVGVQNLSGGVVNSPWDITVCAGTQVSFDIQATDANAGQIVTLYWNGSLASTGGTFVQTGNPAVQDTITGTNPTGTCTWTPPAPGVYTVLFSMQDDACPIVGFNQFTVTINVNGGLTGATAAVNFVNCLDYQLTANPGGAGTGPYTYQWSGDGNINMNPLNNTATFTHTFPGPGSYNWTCVITDSYGCQEVITNTLVIGAGPTADAGPTASICSGYSFTMGGPAIGGQTYSWTPTTGLSNPNSANPTLTYTNTGATPDTLNYVLTASASGCTAVDYTTVIVYPTPVASISGNINICLGDATTLTASGGTSYLWNTGDTTASITVSPATSTTYTVTAIGNGCSSQPTSVTVNVQPGPTAIISGPTGVCAGSSATLTAVGGSSWQWSTGATTQTITLNNIFSDTTVTVIPFNGTCQGLPVSYTVTINEKPVADFTNTTVCFGDITTFNDASTYSGNITSHEWSFGDASSGASNFSNLQDPTHEFTAAGNYQVTLTITSDNGCKDTLTRNVVVNPLPTPDFTFEDVCVGETMTFNDQTPGSITNWSWNFGDNTTSTQQNPTHTYGANGSYNVTLTVTDANGCTDSKTKTVFVHPRPEPNFTYVHRCFNTFTEFTATSTINDPFGTTVDAHSWNFGDPQTGANNTSNVKNPVHYWSGPGTYQVTVTVTSSQGCTSTITVPVTVPEVSPLITHNDTICRGNSAHLTVNAPSDPSMVIEWYYTSNGSTPFHTGTSWDTPPLEMSTTYYVGLLAPDGCRSALTSVRAVVIGPPSVGMTVNSQDVEIPNALVEFTATVPPNQTITSWAWTFGDGGTSSDQNPVHQYTEPGQYTVTLTVVNEWGCESYYAWGQYIEVTEYITILVPTAFTPNGDGLNDNFEVASQLITEFQIDLFDRWGKQIYSSQDLSFSWDGTDVSGQPLPEGVYAWVIKARNYHGALITKSGSLTLIR